MSESVTLPDEVTDAEDVHRLLNPRSGAFKPDGTISYMAFYSSTDPHHISVDRADYRSTEESLRGREYCGLGRLNVGRIRGLKFDKIPSLKVVSLPENGNAAHAEIHADTKASKNGVKNLVCLELAKITTVVVAPPPPEP